MSEYCPYCNFDENDKPDYIIGVNFLPKAHIGAELMRVGRRETLPLLDKLFGYVSNGKMEPSVPAHFLKVFAYIPGLFVNRWASFPISYCPMCGRDLKEGE